MRTWIRSSPWGLAAMLLFPPAGALAGQTLPEPEKEVFHQDVAWSPDGRWIAFSEFAGGDYDPEKWAVWVVAADGSGRRRVVENALWVSWSPDGERLAVSSSRDGNWDLYSVATAGGDLRRLTSDDSKDSQPAFSPRGGEIAFSSDRDGNQEIYVIETGGSKVRRLTRDPAGDFNPAWSPDGGEVVFYREKGDGKDQIHAVGADGSGERAVTRDQAHNVFPSFLPDGRIGFSSRPREGEPTVLVDVSADGTDRRRVGGIETFFARWSPDGRHVAFIAGRWPRSAIYVMEADGSQVRKIVN